MEYDEYEQAVNYEGFIEGLYDAHVVNAYKSLKAKGLCHEYALSLRHIWKKYF